MVAVLVLVAACADGEGAGGPGGDGIAGAASPLAFTDVTGESGLAMTVTSGRVPPTQILEVKGGGLALFDQDADGDLDVFVPNGATLDAPSDGPGARLWENVGGLRFRDATGGLDFRRWGMGVAVGDTDADGDDDLFVACFGRDGWIENRGAEGLRAGAPGEVGLDHEAWGMAAAFGDLDTDGDLDLYLANYLAFDPASPPPGSNFLGVPVFAGPRPLPPVADVLYENRDGRFVDVTEVSGCGAVAPAYGLGVAILDFDRDGHQDVFVGNDSMENFLFRGDGAMRFTDVGRRSGIATDADGNAQATMGIAVADVDGDGRPDVFTTNFQSDTNTLHVGLGDMLFQDSTASMGLARVSQTYLGWAALFGDWDHDGDEDLVVFSGHVYSDETAAELGTTRAQEPLSFAREPAGFERLDAARGGAWVDARLCARGAAAGDLDGDHDLDLVAVELGGPVHVLRNDATLGEGLLVDLAGRPGNPHALGACIELTAAVDGAELRQTRWVYHGGGYQSSGPASAHFGLPPGTGPVELTVVWPGGERTRRGGVAPGGRVTIARE